jgi:hypothetical protein
MRLLQKYLSSPNAFIGDKVFQAVTTGFPIRNASGMTVFGVLQEALLKEKGVLFGRHNFHAVSSVFFCPVKGRVSSLYKGFSIHITIFAARRHP